MDNIQLTKYYDEPKNRYNIYSVVIFMLDRPYRSTLEYYEGLQQSLKHFKTVFKSDWFLRIYFDKSIYVPKNKDIQLNNEILTIWKPIVEQLKNKKYNFVQMVEYYHPDFIVDETHHDGLFGTFVRMLPMFNYYNENTNLILISDIDGITPELLKYRLDVCNKLEHGIYKFHFKSSSCQYLIDRFMPLYEKIVTKYRPFAGMMTSVIKFPKEWLNEFITNIGHKTNDKIYNIIDNFGKLTNNSKAISKKLNYGIDEIFTSILLDHIIDSDIKVACSLYPSIQIPFYIIAQKSHMYADYNDSKNMKKLFKIILGKYYDTNENVQSLYATFDSIIYNKTVMRTPISYIDKNSSRIKKYDYVASRALTTIQFLLDNNIYHLYKFTKEIVECALNNKSIYTTDFTPYDNY